MEIQDVGQAVLNVEDFEGKRSISIEEAPEVEKFILSKITSKKGYKYGKGQNSEGSVVLTPFGNIPLDDITEVIDTLGNTNYTFRLLPDRDIGNRFFNIIVHKSPETHDISSYVLEYEMADSFAEAYANGSADFSTFTGKLKRYGLEEFLEGAEKEKQTQKACEQEGVSTISSPSCDETPFDNGDPSGNDGDISDPTDGTDSGTGSGGGGSGGGGGGTSPGVDCAIGGLYVTGCGGTNSGTPHTAVSCGGNLGIATFYNLMVCSDGSTNFEELKRNVVGKGGSCGGPGPVAIEPVPFYKLSFSLNISTEISNWLDQNCVLKNQIYSFLNRNLDNDGDWSEEAKEFAQWVIVFENSTQVPCGVGHDCVRSIRVMADGLRKFLGEEGILMADYFDSLIADFDSFTLSDLQGFYDTAKAITQEYNDLMFASIVGDFIEGVTPILEIALFEMGLPVAVKLLQKIPVSWVYRGTRLNKVVKKVGLLGKQGSNNSIREVVTNSPVTKARELFNSLTKHAISRTTQSNGAIVADMGKGNFIIYRPITASSSNVPATISLDFKTIWSKPLQVKFLNQ